jgi:hypothetical protein
VFYEIQFTHICFRCFVPFTLFSSRTYVDVVCFLLGNSPASEFYMPTFRNICLFHLHRRIGITYPRMKMEQSVSKRRHIKFIRRGELPRRKHTTFRIRRKFEIKNTQTGWAKSRYTVYYILYIYFWLTLYVDHLVCPYIVAVYLYIIFFDLCILLVMVQSVPLYRYVDFLWLEEIANYLTLISW